MMRMIMIIEPGANEEPTDAALPQAPSLRPCAANLSTTGAAALAPF